MSYLSSCCCFQSLSKLLIFYTEHSAHKTFHTATIKVRDRVLVFKSKLRVPNSYDMVNLYISFVTSHANKPHRVYFRCFTLTQRMLFSAVHYAFEWSNWFFVLLIFHSIHPHTEFYLVQTENRRRH